MNLKDLSIQELEALRDQKNAQVDLLKLEVRGIMAEIKSRTASQKVAELMSQMSDEDKQRLITRLAPSPIQSAEKFGKLGG